MEQNQDLTVQERLAKQEYSRQTLEQLSNEELIALFQNDVMPAFDVLVTRFKDPLLNYIYRFVGNYDDACDILQDTFLRVYDKKHMYKSIAKVSTWIYTIAGNLAKTTLRRPQRSRTISITQSSDKHDEFEIPLLDGTPLPDRMSDSALKSLRIQGALMKLPPMFREAVILRDVQDMPYEEIAELTGMPLGTIKSRINRGRQQLMELLKDIYD